MIINTIRNMVMIPNTIAILNIFHFIRRSLSSRDMTNPPYNNRIKATAYSRALSVPFGGIMNKRTGYLAFAAALLLILWMNTTASWGIVGIGFFGSALDDFLFATIFLIGTAGIFIDLNIFIVMISAFAIWEMNFLINWLHYDLSVEFFRTFSIRGGYLMAVIGFAGAGIFVLRLIFRRSGCDKKT